MKFNKWTLGLAAVGAVSLASAARADEAKLSPLNTALSNTTISGYVDVGAQYNLGNQSYDGYVPAGTSYDKVDSFSLNDVDIAIDKPEDESPWASGYHAEFNLGTDAVGWDASSSGYSTAVRQAYVTLRTPVGNGIDWKFGVQDDIIGYEGNTDGSNPNYTRSIGYSLEPTTLLGLIGTYKVIDNITIQGGIAESTTAESTGDNYGLSSKTFAGAIAFTAPDSWGWLKGGTLNIGTLLNLEKYGQNNFYAGLTIPTPWSALKAGASFDLVSQANEYAGNPQNDSGWDVALYGNIQATDKLSFNLRGEYYDLTGDNSFSNYGLDGNGRGEEVTATVQYNLWANVISRAEFRWDHSDSGDAFGYPNGSYNGFNYNSTATANSYILAVNLIYQF